MYFATRNDSGNIEPKVTGEGIVEIFDPNRQACDGGLFLQISPDEAAKLCDGLRRAIRSVRRAALASQCAKEREEG